MTPSEGVTKFTATHDPTPLPDRRFGALSAELLAWREVLARLDGIGQDDARYDGAGYGNVSTRVGPFPGARGARPFLISGTKTGALRCVDPGALCLVSRYDIAQNHVISQGATPPSSESMTHGAVYDLAPHIRWVLHVHCPEAWTRAKALRLPTTQRDIDYGTPEMAREVGRLARESALMARQMFAMGGHEDGLVAFGRTAEEAGSALISVLAKAFALNLREAGRLCTPRRRS